MATRPASAKKRGRKSEALNGGKEKFDIGYGAPRYVQCKADYPALLYKAINAEGECVDEDIEAANDSFSTEGNSGGDGRTPSAITAGIASQPEKKRRLSGNAGMGDASSSKAPSRQHKKRQRVRQEEIAKYGHQVGSKIALKHLEAAQPIKTVLDTSALPAAHGAYTAVNKPRPADPSRNPTVDKFMAEHPDFQYVAADDSGACRPILDRNGLICGLIAPPPKTEAYAKSVEDLLNIIIEESSSNTFANAELRHKRGVFPVVNFGFTLPNGFKEPINLSHSRHTEKVERIASSHGFTQISNVQNAMLSFWYPGMYDYQKSRVEQVLAADPALRCTSTSTVFPTTAVNFKNTCCFEHRDTQNCPFGWCAITALGNFDHTRGAHLILWEMKLIIEFPHGYTILIPSATVTHSNTPAAEGDTRVSITQYCAGSILRYADNLFNTDKALREKNPALFEQNQAAKDVRWKMSLGLMSTVEDLKKRKRPTVPLFQ